MPASKKPSSPLVFNAFGTLLSELTSDSNHIAATWIRLIPVVDASKDVIIDPITGKSVKVPLRTTVDLIGMDYTDTVDLLTMGGFVVDPTHDGKLSHLYYQILMI
jgi:hypothetical protein